MRGECLPAKWVNKSLAVIDSLGKERRKRGGLTGRKVKKKKRKKEERGKAPCWKLNWPSRFISMHWPPLGKRCFSSDSRYIETRRKIRRRKLSCSWMEDRNFATASSRRKSWLERRRPARMMIRVARYRFPANLHAQDFYSFPSPLHARRSRPPFSFETARFDMRYRNRMEPTSTSLPRRPINFSCSPSAPLNAPR